MTWGSHMSNFHRVTQYGSKIRHTTVTGVTCDTACLLHIPVIDPSLRARIWKADEWCRWDNCPLYELPPESSLGAQSVLKLLTLIQHPLDIQNPMWKLVGLKPRISEVLQTLLYLSQKIHLILVDFLG